MRTQQVLITGSSGLVLTSGFSEFDIAARLKADAQTSFLRKPFTRQDLAEKISLVVGRHAPA